MLSFKKISVLAALLSFGCAPGLKAGAGAARDNTAAFQINATQCFERAQALEKVGNHLEAGIYFEAALRYGGDEERILPRLVAAQVRSGRLRAARKNVERLTEIDGDNPHVRELGELLASRVPASDESDFDEVAR